MKRQGILMPVASLPSNHGIGDFGQDSYDFIDMMKEAGMNLWQILPLNPLGFGNSPYQPYSSYAGDELYINLDKLSMEGMLPKVKPFQKHKDRIDYNRIRDFKSIHLKRAFDNFNPDENYCKFIEQTWVYEYAVYLTLKKKNHLVCWNEWPKEQQDWITDRKYDISPYKKEIEYEMFIQYEFYKQWFELKSYANQKGIQIMGDIPMYVGIDSLDVWSNQKCFLLDADSKPSFVAGVPPDYFSVTGQRWGNPIYDWEYIKDTNFQFWIERLSYNSKMFDIIRIDHFRAFDTYWKIPASCDTAIEGDWILAPGYALFDEVFRKLKDINIVVEDLGELRPEVLELRDYYNFKGMKIIQFSFGEEEVARDSFKQVESLIVYTGTHDNQTMKGWYKDQSHEMKKRVKEVLKKYDCMEGTIAWRFVEFTYKLNSYMSIVPLQDIIGMDDDGRINIPGTLGSPNWEWRLKNLKDFKKHVPGLFKLISKKN